MRGHKTRLNRLNKSISTPEKITLLIEYADGEIVSSLPLDTAIVQEAERAMVLNGDQCLMSWIPADLWDVL